MCSNNICEDDFWAFVAPRHAYYVFALGMQLQDTGHITSWTFEDIRLGEKFIYWKRDLVDGG